MAEGLLLATDYWLWGALFATRRHFQLREDSGDALESWSACLSIKNWNFQKFWNLDYTSRGCSKVPEFGKNCVPLNHSYSCTVLSVLRRKPIMFFGWVGKLGNRLEWTCFTAGNSQPENNVSFAAWHFRPMEGGVEFFVEWKFPVIALGPSTFPSPEFLLLQSTGLRYFMTIRKCKLSIRTSLG